NHDARAHAPAARAQVKGSAHKKGISGRPKTSSGAATSISTSCCDMCAEKSTLPHACSGETSAMTSASQPPAKLSASHVRIALRFGASRQSRTNPVTNNNAQSVNEKTTNGSKLQ